jgi:hypothetical protein
MIVCSYFCDEAFFPCSQRMRASASELGLEIDVRRLPDQGSWEGNAALLPTFSRQMLDIHVGVDLLIIDPDAVFRTAPQRLLKPDFEEDVALFFAGTGKPHPGTLFLKNTRKARMFLNQWNKINETRGGLDCYGALVAVTTKPLLVQVCHLGPEYYWVDRVMRPSYPGIYPVVEYFMQYRVPA